MNLILNITIILLLDQALPAVVEDADEQGCNVEAHKHPKGRQYRLVVLRLCNQNQNLYREHVLNNKQTPLL